ncbi:MAG: diphosphomevalonate decarboxylase [Legionellaceae bacterium]|nr:diphosphomevalonate decarboxylase [Legionellaceae bacterium]
MQWFAQAPANIALIKYMGKLQEGENEPENPSFSYSLPKLLSSVQMETIKTRKDYWEPLHSPGAPLFVLSEPAQQRYLQHLTRIKDHFNYQGSFVVRSNNNFPLGSGLASSASSFAALTKCAALAICELTEQPLPDVMTLARLSQRGSGSSCRSFFSPWAIWGRQWLGAVKTHWMQLEHQVIVLSTSEKTVSSSEAHQRVKTSPAWSGRRERATTNLKELIQAMEAGDWATSRSICWREFEDMHQLFATASEPFHYITPIVREALDLLQRLWEEMGDGPIVTMDAGPNIHLLYRPDQSALALKLKQDYLLGNYDVL